MRTLLAEWEKREGGFLHQKFAILHNRNFEDSDDAAALCNALTHPRADELDGDFESWVAEPAWFTLAWMMFRARSDAARSVIAAQGLPTLKERIEFALSDAAVWSCEKSREIWRCRHGEPRHHLFLIALLVEYGHPEALQLIAIAARHPRFEHVGNLQTLGNWRQLLQLTLNDLEKATLLLDLLRDPIPRGDIREAYLGFANQLVAKVDGTMHPFDTPAGMSLLLQMARQSDDEDSVDDPPALTVVEVLPFITGDKDLLIATLKKQRNPSVRSSLRKALGARI